MEAPDFFVEDLLDLSNAGPEDLTATDNLYESVTNSPDSSTFTPVESYNSPVSLPLDSHFSSALSLPYDDELAELEWLSNFVEESFSCDSFQKLNLIPQSANPNLNSNSNPNPQSSVPGKARSKRSRVAPCDWSTRLVMVSPPTPPATATSSSSCSGTKKSSSPVAGEVRRCLHCAAEKTPQWRTGPMGPKTLCNACGVRYKSGRLVAEYRPAASPTFVSAKHSNSHRKVVELRRQKDLHRQQHHQFMHHHHQQAISGGVSNGGNNFLIHHQHHFSGPEYH